MFGHADTPDLPVSFDRAGEYRALAARPLPALRPVADFVALPTGSRTLSLDTKFALAVTGAVVAFMAGVALAFVLGGPLAALVSWPYTLALFVAVVAGPAALAAFRCVALLLDDSPPVQRVQPISPVTVVLVAAADPDMTAASLTAIAGQDYRGPRRVVLVDPAPNRERSLAVHQAAVSLQLPLEVVTGGPTYGDPRNVGLAVCTTPLVLAVQAGARLHPSALRLLVARLESGDAETVAVGGHDLIRNRGVATSAELAAGEASVDLDTVARIETLLGGPLALSGSCTLFRADALRAVNGWPEGGGSDVVVTWRFLERGWHVAYETVAIVFTDDDITIGSPVLRRARRARAVRSSARESGGTRRLVARPSRILARLDRVAPWLDAAFLIGCLQAIGFLGTGRPGLAFGYAALVAPVTLGERILACRAQREVFEEAGLGITVPARPWLGPLVSLAAVQGPAALWAYAGQAKPGRARE